MDETREDQKGFVDEELSRVLITTVEICTAIDTECAKYAMSRRDTRQNERLVQRVNAILSQVESGERKRRSGIRVFHQTVGRSAEKTGDGTLITRYPRHLTSLLRGTQNLTR